MIVWVLCVGSRIRINYHKSANIFIGPGVQLRGLENSDKIVSFREREDVALRNTQFVVHNDPQTKVL